MQQLHPDFPETQRPSIEALRNELAVAFQRPVTTEYGSTDEGQHWAAICTEDAYAVPTALVSILTGAGVPGEATVLARNGAAIREGVSFPAALKVARSACMKFAPRRPKQVNASR